MDVFEFILVLVTVIVSLGIAELLGGVVRVLRHELKPGYLHSLWIFLVFNMQIQWLWFSWNFRAQSLVLGRRRPRERNQRFQAGACIHVHRIDIHRASRHPLDIRASYSRHAALVGLPIQLRDIVEQ